MRLRLHPATMRTFLGRLVPRRFSPAAVTVGTILLVLLLFALRLPVFEVVELKSYDLRVQARGARPTAGVVAIAAIDEKSIEAEGRWPWPRSKIAALIRALSDDGARVIAFDVVFAEPDTNSALQLAAELARTVDSLRIQDARLASFISDRRLDADSDLALANAIRDSSAATVLGYFFHMRRDDLGYDLSAGERAERERRIRPFHYPVIMSREPDLSSIPFIDAYAPQPNLEVLHEAAAFAGYFTVLADPDGILRWVPLAIRSGDDVYPSVSLVCVWEYLHRPELVLYAGRYGVDGVQLGDSFIPTHETGQLLVNYMGPPRTFPHVPITDVLHGRSPPGTFKDKIVLVGATAVGTNDLRSTPFSPVHPGPEVHATVIDNVLTGRMLQRPAWWRSFDVLAIVLLTAFVGVVVPRLGAVKGLAVQSGLFVGYAGGITLLFVRHDVWLNAVYPLFAASVNYTALTTYRYLTEERERRKLKGAFRQYVAPEVVDEMMKDPARLQLGGEEKVLTVLFCDLEGFTTYSERHSPREMIGILSDYYAKMTEEVFAHGGTLKEYVGDELMAIFGAPLEQPDHAVRACRVALAMRDARDALSTEWAPAGRPRLRARTGVNSGPMLVGNLGSKYRFAYGVLGDQVNLGSRLEGLNRSYGTEIIVGENTAALLGDAFVLRELDKVRAKGKKVAIRVFELVANGPSAIAPVHREALATYAAGLEAYRARRFPEALALFHQALAARPGDEPSRVMAERARLFLHCPPPDGWDGVFDQTLVSLKGAA